MSGLSRMLMTPKMTATISSVSTFATWLCPVSTIPGTSQAATPSAAAMTRNLIRIFMGSFYSTYHPETPHFVSIDRRLPGQAGRLQDLRTGVGARPGQGRLRLAVDGETHPIAAADADGGDGEGRGAGTG